MTAVRSSSTVTLGIVFAAVVTSFVLATAAAEYDDVRIQWAAKDIVDNATPSLEYTSEMRAEIRRLATWFDTFFYRDVTERLLGERMLKRIVTRESPDAKVLRDAMKAAVEYLEESRQGVADQKLAAAQ